MKPGVKHSSNTFNLDTKKVAISSVFLGRRGNIKLWLSVPLNFMSINKRHIPLNRSLNREHHTPVTLSPQITVHSVLASAGICLHHISVFTAAGGLGVVRMGGKSESEISGDERLEKGGTSRAHCR